MHIVHVVRQFHPSIGGLEDVVGLLAHAQQRQGHIVDVVTLDRVFADPTHVLPAREVLDEIEIVRVPYVGSRRYPLAFGALRHLGLADLVHVHAIDFFFDALAWTRPFHRKPLVATTHGGFFHTRAHAGLKRAWFKTVTRRSASRYDAIIACSRSDRAMFQAISPDNLYLVENGVDIGKFAGCSSPVPMKRLATIGRFALNKRLDRVLDTMSRLVAQDPTWRLDIIGAPSDWTLERLKSEIGSRALGPHVDAHASPSNVEIRRLLQRSSLFVSASEHEGFGLVLIEALSAGLMPVVQANDAFRSLADRLPLTGLTDFAAPEIAAAAIEARFAALEADPAVLRQRAQASVRAYEWSEVANRYFEVYRDVLDGTLAVYGERALT